MKNFARIALAMAAMLAWAGPSWAFPDRPVQLIVPWAAGGGMDSVMRIFANGLENELKVPINVINRTGGGGLTGHTFIANAPPDGYTIGGASPEISFYKTLGLGELTVDSLDLFSRLSLIPAGITVKADGPYKTAADYLKAVKESPKGTLLASGTGYRRIVAHRLGRYPEGGRPRAGRGALGTEQRRRAGSRRISWPAASACSRARRSRPKPCSRRGGCARCC